MNLSEYLLDNYGKCSRGAFCICLKSNWIGQQCQCWIPLGVTTYEELDKYYEELYSPFDMQPKRTQ